MSKAIAIGAVIALILSSGVMAGNNPGAKVAVHVRAHDGGLGCDYGTIDDCHDIVTTEPSQSVDAFTVFFDLTEYLGCEYGMCWPEWNYSGAFTNCADMVVGSIALPGDGASHTWLTCQTGACVPSFVWLYADDAGIVYTCPHPVSGEIFVLDCADDPDAPIAWFGAGVYGVVGDDPCPPVGTSHSSWSTLKDLFK
jgi:hypothetical protein